MPSFGDYRVTGIEACAALLDNAGSVAETRFDFTRVTKFDPSTKKIKYEGDGKEKEREIVTGLTVEIETDTLSISALKTVYNKTEVTTGLPTDATVRMYMIDKKDRTGIPCGLAVYVTAEHRTTSANTRLRIVAPRGTLSSPKGFDFKTADKEGLKLSFAADPATTDIAGDALPGVDSDGAFYYWEVLT